MTSQPHTQRYHPISSHYRERFGCKVYKLSVSISQTCPNRLGLGGMKLCRFCDPWGSAAYAELVEKTLSQQIQEVSARLRKRYHAEKFLVYFQSYTNTYLDVPALAASFAEALTHDDVVGLVVGTRPDCLPEPMLELLSQTARQTYLGIELGAQSFDDAQLRFLQRGHTAAQNLTALQLLGQIPGINLCVHLMFGLPGETLHQLKATAGLLNSLRVDGVKLHNLHVLKRTLLGRDYQQGKFTPIALPEYARRVVHFLEALSPLTTVHRLSAVSSRWDELMAPDWSRHKMMPMQEILDMMDRMDTWQGKQLASEAAPGSPGTALINAANPLENPRAMWSVAGD